MYSARRSQIEHKVRAARQRTLAPGKHGEKASRSGAGQGMSASTPALTYEAPAYAGPPVAPPPRKGPTSSGPVGLGLRADDATPGAPTFHPTRSRVRRSLRLHTSSPPPAYEPAPPGAPASGSAWSPAPRCRSRPSRSGRRRPHSSGDHVRRGRSGVVGRRRDQGHRRAGACNQEEVQTGRTNRRVDAGLRRGRRATRPMTSPSRGARSSRSRSMRSWWSAS